MEEGVFCDESYCIIRRIQLALKIKSQRIGTVYNKRSGVEEKYASPAVVARTCNPRAWEAKAGELM